MNNINENSISGKSQTKGKLMKINKRQFFANYTLILVFIVLYIVFSIAIPTKFASVDNFKIIFSSQAVLLMLALAMLIPMIVGEFDLSAAQMLGLSQIIVTGLMSRNGFPVGLAIFCTLAISAVVGAINGLLITKLKINSIIATIGMQTVLYAIVFAYTEGGYISSNIPPEFVIIARGELFGVRYSVFYVIALFILFWYILEMTPLGRKLYAVGGSKEAARLVGINVTRYTIFACITCSVIASFAGIVLGAQLGAGQPTQGPQLLMPALTAVFLGAAAIKAGTPNVLGLVVAILTLATGVTGFQLLGADMWVEYMFYGLALIIGMALVRYLNREAI